MIKERAIIPIGTTQFAEEDSKEKERNRTFSRRRRRELILFISSWKDYLERVNKKESC